MEQTVTATGGGTAYNNRRTANGLESDHDLAAR